MRSDNKGFSLVEIIIVVAIMAAITGVAGYGLSLSSGKAADECARKLASSIQHARAATMGKFETKIKISMNADGIWAQETTTVVNKDDGTAGDSSDGEAVKVGDKNVKVEFYDGTGSAPSVWSDGMSMEFEFDRGSGALRSHMDIANKTGVAKIYFKISKASRTEYVVIVPLTGRVTVTGTDPATTP